MNEQPTFTDIQEEPQEKVVPTEESLEGLSLFENLENLDNKEAETLIHFPDALEEANAEEELENSLEYINTPLEKKELTISPVKKEVVPQSNDFHSKQKTTTVIKNTLPIKTETVEVRETLTTIIQSIIETDKSVTKAEQVKVKDDFEKHINNYTKQIKIDLNFPENVDITDYLNKHPEAKESFTLAIKNIYTEFRGIQKTLQKLPVNSPIRKEKKWNSETEEYREETLEEKELREEQIQKREELFIYFKSLDLIDAKETIESYDNKDLISLDWQVPLF